MTIAEWTIFGAVLLYLLTIAPVKAIGYSARFDNANPRDPAFYTPGIRTRAFGAHLNGIEVFPFFAAAVLLAEFRGMPQHLIDLLAVAFLVVRCAYVRCLSRRPADGALAALESWVSHQCRNLLHAVVVACLWRVNSQGSSHERRAGHGRRARFRPR